MRDGKEIHVKILFLSSFSLHLYASITAQHSTSRNAISERMTVRTMGIGRNETPDVIGTESLDGIIHGRCFVDTKIGGIVTT